MKEFERSSMAVWQSRVLPASMSRRKPSTTSTSRARMRCMSGFAPDPIHRLGLTKDGVQTRIEICGGTLSILVIRQRAGDHKAHHKDAAADDARDQGGRRQSWESDSKYHCPQTDDDRDDNQGCECEPEVSEGSHAWPSPFPRCHHDLAHRILGPYAVASTRSSAGR
jgi:hypothetical protein